ncbi:MAG: PorP/SprF family type IX secretion system membrane protein [Saprospiraceae bacterium]|nr:PorP/SprF family type IX secretion system membrane protein [Saprospiraceae bacterium]
MKLKILVFITCALFSMIQKLSAQDIHFTQFSFSPLHVNPAQTGGFNGSYRIGGIFRDQVAAVTGIGSEFRTIHFFIDANLTKGFRKQDWVGFGMNFLQDRSGVISLGSGGFIAAAAYHLGIGKNSDISVGAQYGAVTMNIKDKEKAIFENSIGGGQSPDLMKLQDRANYRDISVGLAYTTSLGTKKHKLVTGVNVARVNNPRVSLSQGGIGNRLGSMISAHASLEYRLNDKLDLIPMIWVRNLKSNTQIAPQCMVSYLFNSEKEIRLNGGLGYRLGDALEIMAGMDIKNIRFQIGFDLTVSGQTSAQSPSGFGAVELAAIYTGNIVKKPNPKPKVFCPRF